MNHVNSETKTNTPTKHWSKSDPDMNELASRYTAWTDMIGKRSAEATYALAAACWILISSNASEARACNRTLLGWSLICCFVYIGYNLTLAFFIKQAILDRYEHAENNQNCWMSEKHDKHFPEGKKAYNLSRLLHIGRFVIIAAASLLFVSGAFPYLAQLNKYHQVNTEASSVPITLSTPSDKTKETPKLNELKDSNNEKKDN